MARVAVLTADLLFGSRIQGMLAARGDEVQLIASVGRLADGLESEPQVLVVDMTDEDLDGAAAVSAARASGALAAARTLAYYSHVDSEARARAQGAGFDLVVPRSRMAREGAELVARLAASGDD
jgi:DNA-binding NarL/FixJ family response regulator